jgi:hypothetical protein
VCVFLLAGSVKLSAVAGAKIGVCGLGKSLVAQTPFEGQIKLVVPDKVQVDAAKGTMTEGKSPCTVSPIFLAMGGKTSAVVIMTAAAAGGTAAGIALTRTAAEPRSGSGAP